MTTRWGLGAGWVTATLVSRQRASGVDRCAYSGGPAPEVRGRLFLPMADPWWLGRAACRPPEVRRRDGLCECPTHGRGLRCGRVHSARPGASCVAGDVRRRRGRESCPRTRGLSPAGADRTRPYGMSPPASGMRSSAAAAEVCDPHQSRRSPVGRRSGARLEDVERERPPIPIKDP